MANELLAHAASGQTLYAVPLGAAGHAWNGSAFAASDGDDWAGYAIATPDIEASGRLFHSDACHTTLRKIPSCRP
jgi:hypothetical protein